MARLARLVGVLVVAGVGALAARRWGRREVGSKRPALPVDSRRGVLSVSGPPAEPRATASRVLQQVVRVREADGGEAIRGWLLAEFVAGQRNATLHVGFCPPLERLPVVEAEMGDGPDAEVKVAQAFAHGARLEVRLASAAEEDCAVVVEMIAKPQAVAASQDGSAI